MSSSSSSCRTTSMDLPNPPSPFVSIINHIQQVHYTTSCVSTELLQIGSSRRSNTYSSVWRSPQENVAYGPALTSPAYLVRLIWIILEMGDRWPYSFCFVGCCFQDLFNMVRSILAQMPSSFFSKHLVSTHVVQPYSCIDTIAATKKLRWYISTQSSFCRGLDVLE